MPIYEFKCDPCGTMFEELFTAGSDNGHVECPECGNDLVERQSKAKGKRGGRSKFYGCSNYPACTFAVNQRPIPPPCP